MLVPKRLTWACHPAFLSKCLRKNSRPKRPSSSKPAIAGFRGLGLEFRVQGVTQLEMLVQHNLVKSVNDNKRRTACA